MCVLSCNSIVSHIEEMLKFKVRYEQYSQARSRSSFALPFSITGSNNPDYLVTWVNGSSKYYIYDLSL